MNARSISVGRAACDTHSFNSSVFARERDCTWSCSLSRHRNDPLRPRLLVRFLLSATTVVAVPNAECWALRETIRLSLVFEQSDCALLSACIVMLFASAVIWMVQLVPRVGLLFFFLFFFSFLFLFYNFYIPSASGTFQCLW